MRPNRLDRAKSRLDSILFHILGGEDRLLVLEAMKAEGLMVVTNDYLAEILLMSEAAHRIGEEAHRKNSTHEFMDPREILETIHTYTGEMYWEPRNG
jgi:hypothetical protein